MDEATQIPAMPDDDSSDEDAPNGPLVDRRVVLTATDRLSYNNSTQLKHLSQPPLIC